MNHRKIIKKTKLLIISFLIMIFLSCNNETKFNKNDWLKSVDGFYLNRDKMINDLTLNHKLIGLSKNDIIKLLGNPENYANIDERIIYYNIVTDFGWNIDPVYIKNLKIKLNSNNIVESFKIVETE